MTTYRVRTYMSLNGTGFLVGFNEAATLSEVRKARAAAVSFNGDVTMSSSKSTGGVYRYNVSSDRLSITVYAVPNK